MLGVNNPEPEVVHAPVVNNTPTVPLTATVGLLAHTEMSPLVITTGALVKFTTNESYVLGHPLRLPVDVNFILMLPADRSPGEGKYVVFKAPVLPKEPDPELVQLVPAANCKVPVNAIGDILFFTKRLNRY